MKKVYLSLEKNEDNDELLSIIQQMENIKLVDIDDDVKDIIVITNGPLTSLSNKLLNNWKLKEKIKCILLVGGSDKYGDVTAVAERNIYYDYNSAQVIFLSGIEIIMFGLNVTRNLENRALAPLVYLHDAYLFNSEECGIYVETKGKKTLGMTVTDLYSDAQFKDHHCKIIKSINLELYNDAVNKLKTIYSQAPN